ncbi:unnamed protein product, partial [Polarella glacialis]
LPSMEEPRHGASAGRVHSRIFVFGGHNGTLALTTAESLDLAVGVRWRSIGDMCHGREGAGGATLAGLIYVCGGLDGNRRAMQSTECFNPNTGRWEQVEVMETRRAFVAATAAPV